MGQFHGRCILEPTGKTCQGRLLFELVEPFGYAVQGYGWRLSVDIPEGFETDGYSIPWIMRRIIAAASLGFEAAVIHDYLCVVGCPRWIADAVFLDAMKTKRVPFVRRYCRYWAVRLWSIATGTG